MHMCIEPKGSYYIHFTFKYEVQSKHFFIYKFSQNLLEILVILFEKFEIFLIKSKISLTLGEAIKSYKTKQ
jgi:hypothetical protein